MLSNIDTTGPTEYYVVLIAKMHALHRPSSPNAGGSKGLPDEPKTIPSSPASTATLEENGVEQEANVVDHEPNCLDHDEVVPTSNEYASRSADCDTGSDATNSAVANKENNAQEDPNFLACSAGFLGLLQAYDELIADLPAKCLLAFSRITEKKLNSKRQAQEYCPRSRQKCALASDAPEFEFSHLEDARYDSNRGWEFLVSWKPTWEPQKNLRGGAAILEAHKFVQLWITREEQRERDDA